MDAQALHEWACSLAGDYLPEGWQHVSSSPYTRVAVNADMGLYFKEFLPRSPAEKFKGWLRGSRATRARNNGDALAQAGFGAPQNVFWGRLPGGGEYLYTRRAAGQTVTQWLRDTRGPEALAQRRALLRALGIFIGRLHATGFVHGDLRPGNVLAHAHDGRFSFTLLDNERTRRLRPPPGRMLQRNLMQLNMLKHGTLGCTDRMRFFRAWHSQMRELDDTEGKIIAAESYRWAMRRLRDKGYRR